MKAPLANFFYSNQILSSFILMIKTSIRIICLRLWRASMATWHFDWSIGGCLNNQNVKWLRYHARDVNRWSRLAFTCLKDFLYLFLYLFNSFGTAKLKTLQLKIKLIIIPYFTCPVTLARNMEDNVATLVKEVTFWYFSASTLA